MDPQGMVVAEGPREPNVVGRYIDEILGPSQPLTTLGERAGVLPLDARRRRGGDRHRPPQSRRRRCRSPCCSRASGVFAEWRRTVSREATVFVATSIVLVILGFAYPRADGARPRGGLHLFGDADALPHGAPPRPLGPVGMGPVARRDLLVAVDVRDPRARAAEPAAFGRRGRGAYQRRGCRSGRARQRPDPWPARARSTASSACATPTGTGSGSARAPRWCADAEDEPHLVGIAVDVTEQRRLAEASRTADLRLRDAIEAISEAFVLWDAANRLVLCNSKYQQLYGLPDELVQPGTPYDEIARSGRRPNIPNTLPVSDGRRRLPLGGGARRRRPLAADQRAAHRTTAASSRSAPTSPRSSRRKASCWRTSAR